MPVPFSSPINKSGRVTAVSKPLGLYSHKGIVVRSHSKFSSFLIQAFRLFIPEKTSPPDLGKNPFVSLFEKI